MYNGSLIIYYPSFMRGLTNNTYNNYYNHNYHEHTHLFLAISGCYNGNYWLIVITIGWFIL